MARQKEFDRDEVLHRAMEVFWMRGYEGTSIQDLVNYMGINRQSLYDTFGDKHSLFLQSLDRYREIQSRKVFDVLERPGSVKKNLRQLFEEVVTPALSAEGRRGCFVGNSMSELAGRCKATANRTYKSVAAAEKIFRRALERGREQGELSRVRDTRAVARFLYCNLQGLLLLAKATGDRKLLSDVVKVTLSVLD
ncbi:MAG TPA: TetR/AcrR family transcriptional regulator [Pyrinomonadaceae bacterium]|jgi:TetR/AcrR family transcriptional repressor of nem operon|nr:TetR/AcrR family transcriptional regulator [Pyrinomonadaceae bacterium]